MTARWRKRMFREHGIRSSVRDKTFCFLTADEAHDFTVNDVDRIGRLTGKTHTYVGMIEVRDLTVERRDRHQRAVEKRPHCSMLCAGARKPLPHPSLSSATGCGSPSDAAGRGKVRPGEARRGLAR